MPDQIRIETVKDLELYVSAGLALLAKFDSECQRVAERMRLEEQLSEVRVKSLEEIRGPVSEGCRPLLGIGARIELKKVYRQWFPAYLKRLINHKGCKAEAAIPRGAGVIHRHARECPEFRRLISVVCRFFAPDGGRAYGARPKPDTADQDLFAVEVAETDPVVIYLGWADRTYVDPGIAISAKNYARSSQS